MWLLYFYVLNYIRVQGVAYKCLCCSSMQLHLVVRSLRYRVLELDFLFSTFLFLSIFFHIPLSFSLYFSVSVEIPFSLLSVHFSTLFCISLRLCNEGSSSPPFLPSGLIRYLEFKSFWIVPL